MTPTPIGYVDAVSFAYSAYCTLGGLWSLTAWHRHIHDSDHPPDRQPEDETLAWLGRTMSTAGLHPMILGIVVMLLIYGWPLYATALTIDITRRARRSIPSRFKALRPGRQRMEQR